MNEKVKYILYGLTEIEVDEILPVLTEINDGEIILVEDEHSLTTMLTHIPEADTLDFCDEVVYIHHNILNYNILMCKLVSINNDGSIRMFKTLGTYNTIGDLANTFMTM